MSQKLFTALANLRCWLDTQLVGTTGRHSFTEDNDVEIVIKSEEIWDDIEKGLKREWPYIVEAFHPDGFMIAGFQFTPKFVRKDA